MTELVDCHTHSVHSDGSGSVLDNVARACELGVATIACTDHFVLPDWLDPDCECSVPAPDASRYLSDVRRAREEYRGRVEVVSGWECDWYPGCEEMIARYRGDATFLLGSVHALDGRWIDDLSDASYWDEHGTDLTWSRYFELWCEACRSTVGFSSMAHPDLVCLLGRMPSSDSLRRDLYDRAARAACDAGVRVEVSSAGAVKPVGRFYPDVELLERFFRLGVPVTVGSDAHSPRRVGDRVSELYDMCRSVGYRGVDVPMAGGGWRTVSL